MKKIIVTTLLIVLTSLTFIACSDESPVQITALKMNYTDITLAPGEEIQLVAQARPADANIAIKWSSSNDELVSVNDNGVVKANASSGSAIITARYGSYSCRCSLTLMQSHPLDVATALKAPISSELIYSRDVVLPAAKRIMQGFDITPSNHIYYSQISAGNGTSTMIAHSARANKPVDQQYMNCLYFGHGTQIVAEEAADGKTYIWMNSNGNMTDDGEYGSNMSVSRVEYQPGAVLENCAGQTYFLNKDGQYDQQVSIDFDHRRLLIGSRKNGRHFWIFDLDEVMALPLKSMTVTTNVEGVNTTRTIQGYDLNDCRVLGNFTVLAGTNKDTDVYSYSHQGHEIYGDFIYFYEGNALEIPNTVQFRTKAYVTVFDYSGRICVPRTEVAALSDTQAWIATGMTKNGWSEPESMKVRADGIYLGVAARDGTSSNRRANILYYKCNELQ